MLWKLATTKRGYQYHLSLFQRIGTRKVSSSLLSPLGGHQHGSNNQSLFLKKKSALSFSSSTYYDSQSGLHVPVHNENEISLILNITSNNNNSNFSIPPQLYKEDVSSSDMPEKLQQLVQQGIHGLVVPPPVFPRDARNIKVLCDIATPKSNSNNNPLPPPFTIFVPVRQSQPLPTPSNSNNNSNNLSAVLEYNQLVKVFSDNNDKDIDNDTQSLSTFLSQKQSSSSSSGEGGRPPPPHASTRTTIWFSPEECMTSEPITIANQVGTLIDTQHLGDYLWLSTTSSSSTSDNKNNLIVDTEDVIRFYEELIYLDVAGPTIQSRLIIETTDSDLIEEAMFSGINKFVISTDNSSITLIQEIAQEQGKDIIVAS